MSNPSPTPESKVPNDPNDVKKPVYRGSNFTSLEDVAVAESWIAVSKNAIKGTEQKNATFHDIVTQLYNTKFKPPNREPKTVKSIQSRRKSIQKECMSCNGCRAKIVRQKTSGTNTKDVLNLAIALYNGVEMKRPTDDCGAQFKFVKAWEVLLTHLKYYYATDVGNKTIQANNSEQNSERTTRSLDENGSRFLNDGQLSDTKPQVRPIARKLAKEQLNKTAEVQKKIKLAVESVAAQVERNETLQRHYELMLFTNDPPECKQSEVSSLFKRLETQRTICNLLLSWLEVKKAEDCKLITEDNVATRTTGNNAEAEETEVKEK